MMMPQPHSSPILRSRGPRPLLAGLVLALSMSLLFTVLGCDDSGGGASTAPVSFGVSDAPVEGLSEVVITIDRIVLNRPGSDDVIIDEFTNEDLGVIDADTIQIDLLDYRGMDNLLIVGPVELDVAEYQNLRLEIIDDDIDRSYVVEEADGSIHPINVPSNELKLGRFEVEDRGDQTFILEFGLRQAMTYNPGPDRYILKPRGVRIVEVTRGSTVGGIVDPVLFDGVPPCDAKEFATVGNVVYLYQGHDLDPADLGDDFDPEMDPEAAASLLSPYASETVAADGSYLFSYMPAGNYTLAFSCDATEDDPEMDDGIFIPLPEDEIVEVSTSPGEDWACDFPVPAEGCELLPPPDQPVL